MSFKKYNSIENSYRQKFIHKFLDKIDVENTKFVALEKLDGANIQLVISPNSTMKVGKRTSFLEENDSFFDIWNTLKKYQGEIQALHNCVNSWGVTLRLYGEIYGPGINNRVDYGPEKQIAIFDIEKNDELMPFSEFYNFMSSLSLEHLVPVTYTTGSLTDCLEFNVESLYNRPGGEGIVIRPRHQEIYNNHGERLIVKKKSNKFEDTRQDAIDKGAGRAEAKGNTLIDNLNIKFRGYITNNRVVDTFAKHGKITDMKQISDYIKLVLEDAKTDFIKDHPDLPQLDQKDEKKLYNAGNVVVMLLKQHL